MTFLEKVGLFQTRKWVWPKLGLAIGKKVEAQSQNACYNII